MPLAELNMKPQDAAMSPVQWCGFAGLRWYGHVPSGATQKNRRISGTVFAGCQLRLANFLPGAHAPSFEAACISWKAPAGADCSLVCHIASLLLEGLLLFCAVS